MPKNNSPWIYQLNRKRAVARLKKNHSADIAIIGGGIAGIATAYFVLRHTKHKVSLIEGGKIAHGATGHNGGFLASYFERTFTDMAKEFGSDKVARGEQDVESAWELLDEIRETMALKTPMWQFTGYAACATIEEVLKHLQNNYDRKRHGLVPELMFADKAIKSQIPRRFWTLCRFMTKESLLETIESEDSIYIAALASRKGCMNSAMFCEELIQKLKRRYPKRFTLAEHTLVNNLVLRENSATLRTAKGQAIEANRVVLCTNGFEKITITNIAGEDINTKFHHLVRGIVGYMAAYVEDSPKPATEISYLPKSNQPTHDLYAEEPYFYLTRRPFYDSKNKGKKLSLVSVGGPEALMDDTNNYKLDHSYPSEARKQIDDFLRYTYKHGIKDKVKYQFLWHGLMGFTPNGVRCIGPEPLNPVLYYNLGCNGVGLLPSIFGGWKIADLLAGNKHKPSMFDPLKKIVEPSVSSGEIPETKMNENNPVEVEPVTDDRLGTILVFGGFLVILTAIYIYFLG